MYRARVDAIAALEQVRVPGRTALAEVVAQGYHKLLAYKDEYEVARLYTDGTFKHRVESQFDHVRSMDFHLAPPMLSRLWKDKATGHPRKVRLPGWLMMPVFQILAKGKRLRGSAWDVFGYAAERRLERQMIGDYERLLDEIARRLSPATYDTALALAGLPLEIKGFGHIKHASHETVRRREKVLLATLRAPPPPGVNIAAQQRAIA